MSVDYTTPLQESVGHRLAELGLVRYSPTGAYADTGLPPVFHGAMPALPVSAVTVNVYDDQRGRDNHSPDVYVQVRARLDTRNPREINDLLAQVFEAFQHTTLYIWPGGVRVLVCERVSRAPLGADTNGRYERADNYRFTLNPIPD
jgi:hypothetical protein